MRDKRIVKYIPVAIVLLVFFILYGMHATASPRWYDEAVEYWVSKYWTGSVPGSRTTSNMYEHIAYTYQPPLYNVLMHFWLVISDTEWWYRLAGILTTLFGAVGIYKAGREAADEKYGLIGMVLYLSVWPVCYYALEAAEYNLMLACIAWMLYFFVKNIHTTNWYNIVGYFIWAVLACYSQYGAAFVVVALYVTLLIHMRSDKRALIRLGICTVITMVVAVIPLVIFFLIPQVRHMRSPEVSHSFYFVHGNAIKDMVMSAYKVFTTDFGAALPGMCIGLLLILSIVCLVRKSNTLNAMLLVTLIIWVLYYVAVATSFYAFNGCDMDKLGTVNIGGRYCLFFIPVIIVTVTAGLGVFSQWFKWEKIVLAGAIVSCVGCTMFMCRSLSTMGPKDDVRQVADIWYDNQAYNSVTYVYWESDANFWFYLVHDDEYTDDMRDGIINSDDDIDTTLEEFYYVSYSGQAAEDMIAAMEAEGYRAEYCYEGRSALTHYVKERR